MLLIILLRRFQLESAIFFNASGTCPGFLAFDWRARWHGYRLLLVVRVRGARRLARAAFVLPVSVSRGS